ncbi:hypothetical protein KAR91_04585 [Candidatus Pacearchaeota archaeon]|nr:hypothetical protein [Candidatus Pacearchaeota archaeon]
MNVDTRMLGERVFFTVIDDYDENWEVVEGDIIGIIIDIELKRTWIQYKIDTDRGYHVISEEYVYSKKSEAKRRCQTLNKVKNEELGI